MIAHAPEFNTAHAGNCHANVRYCLPSVDLGLVAIAMCGCLIGMALMAAVILDFRP
jgi:hypothetical protein